MTAVCAKRVVERFVYSLSACFNHAGNSVLISVIVIVQTTSADLHGKVAAGLTPMVEYMALTTFARSIFSYPH